MGFYNRNASLIGSAIGTNKPGVYDLRSLFLYPYVSFSALTFTNAGQTGPAGPSLAQCESAYSGAYFVGTSDFAVNNGYQSFLIPVSGTYRFTLGGASGGVWTTSPMTSASAALAPTIEGYPRPPGALLVGEYALTAGQVITMVVGQGGGDDDNAAANCPGGGGGTFVTLGDYDSVVSRIDTLLFVAGGGGGAGYQSLDASADNYSTGIGQDTTSGGTSGESGGTGGSGAPSVQSSGNSSGGAGYLTGPGSTTTSDFSYTVPSSAIPTAFRYGAKGGSFTGSLRGYGGFGGGGQGANSTSSDDDKGGGGGYSGGGYAFDAHFFGGGGGSYGIVASTITAGGNTTNRHGFITMELV